MSSLPSNNSSSFINSIPLKYRILLLIGVILIGLVALVGDHSTVDSGQSEGYWGKVTATVDWCEENYNITPYIAEFYNTISNIGYVIVALLGILLQPNLEFRYAVGYASISVIGIGSSMFHATLLFSAQLCDELPMFYFVCVLYYICIEYNHVIPKYTLYPWFMVIFSTIFTIIYYYYPFPTLFQVGWGLFVFYTAYLSIKLVKNVKSEDTKVGDVGFGIMVFSIIVWITDQAFCSPTIRIFKLHAIWHFGTALAAYYSITAMWFYRVKYILKKNTNYKWFLWFIPYIKV